MLELVIDHLWQSTLIVLIAWGAATALRRYEARWRYWVWFAASMKFLVPFALIAQLGAQIPWPATGAATHQSNWQVMAVRVLNPVSAIEPPARVPDAASAASPAPADSIAAQILQQDPAEPGPSTGPVASSDRVVNPTADRAGLSLALMALVVWALGSALLLARWGLSWVQLRSMLARSKPLRFESGEPGMPELRACSSVMEPGIFGIFKPVLLIPEPLLERLSRDQLRAIVRHERVHAQRHDNFTASLHMLVEALFWFHPFVWWIGARLIDERERACDEAVLASGVDPDVYASGLIEVCDFYAQSPLMCTAGVGGGSLKERIGRIADNERLPVPGRLIRTVLATMPGAIVLVPLALGLLEVQAVRAQQAAPEQGSNLLECVHPDVIASLLFPGGVAAATVLSDQMPAEMAEVVTPPAFDLIGSQVRDVSGLGFGVGLIRNVTASFKTDLAPDAAVDDAMAALTGNGWALVETNSSILGMSNAVFASAGPPRPEVACLDDQAVSVNANAIDGVTYVNYGIQVGAPSTACSPNGRMLSSPGAQYAPQLSLPIDPATGQTARTGGGGSSGTQSRVEIRYSGSLAELTQFMTQQLIDQGWVNDASWSGSTTAGSSWVKKPDDETRVAGTLDVTATTGANYTIMFRLVGLQ